MWMHRSEARGYAPDDRASAVITGTLAYHGEHVVMITPDGTTVTLPKGTVLTYAPEPSRVDLQAFDRAGS